MEQRLMPDILDVREITYTNLLLLDFKPDVYEAKYHCPFNRDAFVFPNKKAMEEVFYFLFMKINPDVAKEEFRHCWPIHDKKQESAFRKVAVQWLGRLNKEVHDSNIPRVVASFLLSPGGDKFYHLLLCFSSFVLKEEIKKTLHKDEALLPWPNTSSTAKSFPQQTSKILTVKATLETERFLKNAQLSSEAQEEWIRFSSELTKENRALRKKRREIEKEMKDLETEHLKRGLLSPVTSRSSRHDSPYDGQIKSLKRTKILQRVREYWNRIKEIFESHKILRRKVDEIIQGTANNCSLRSSDLNIKIPDLLLRECEDDIYQKRIGNTFDSGRVNLLSLVQLLNLSLQLILDQVRSYPLPAISDEVTDVKDKLHAQNAYLQTTESLKEIIEREMIPELKDSIKELEEMIWYSNSVKRHFTPKASRPFDFSLTGLPMTPSVQLFSGKENGDTKGFATFSKDLFSTENVPTPDAVDKMVQSLRDVSTMKSPDEAGKRENGDKPPRANSVKIRKSEKKIPRPKFSSKAKSTVKKRVPKKNITNYDDATMRTVYQNLTPLRNEMNGKENVDLNSNGNNEIDLKNRNAQSIKRENDPQSGSEEKALDILAEKIAFSVLSKDDLSRPSSSSSNSTTPQEHYLDYPVSAINKDAFVTKDRIQRTPLKKEKQSTERHSLRDTLDPYLASSLPNTVATPNSDRRFLSESFAETPARNLFDGPLCTKTPKIGDDTVNRIRENKLDDFAMSVPKMVDIGGEENRQFDRELSTPIIERVIKSSVNSSVLRPKNGEVDYDQSPPMRVKSKKETGRQPRHYKIDDNSVELNPKKDDLAELIQRYKNLKMKSKEVVDIQYASEADDDNDDGKNAFLEAENNYVDDYNLQVNQAAELQNTKKHEFPADSVDKTPTKNESSFLEIARNSAKTEMTSWSHLKDQITLFDDDDVSKNKDFIDSFDDLQIPVAKQLSFVQLDTRNMSPHLVNKNDVLVARGQSSGVKNVQNGIDDGFHSYEQIYSSLPRKEEHNGKQVDSLLVNNQSEAITMEYRNVSKEVNDKLQFDSEEWIGSRLENEPRLESEDSPIRNLASIERHISASPQRVGANELNGSQFYTSLYKTPKFKPLDDSFNIVTPGIDKLSGAEMIAFDLETSGINGGLHDVFKQDLMREFFLEKESTQMDQDVNLIDF